MYALIRDVARVSRLFMQDSVYCGGVTFIQFTILDLVRGETSGLEMADLHTMLAVEKSTTTRLIAPLVEKKLLVRSASPRNPRALRLTLTEAGRQVHREYWECMSGNIRAAGAGFSRQKFEQVRDSMALFVTALQRWRDESCC